jgi:hypothetical protein
MWTDNALLRKTAAPPFYDYTHGTYAPDVTFV